ncbi:type-F conjugative transfer system pilin assembly protein TraF (plasmid) [Burkholderia sp. SFA1]|uniref:Sex pilus assembly protein n=1 Tax=Burkholderia vietnamiensis (strain G4 / LMG 22486) TaxID=269482 RepID=A4JTN6_BURVG|nr:MULTISPECIES: conjugal transfer protein TraF [Caballeronia]ABO59639.1 sex pilus assembly protein [Burkholderia vietnamiensis G4]AET95495.1 sex pilus assembly protein [Burkholderia sp. YI23]MCB4350201.1 conjugal transfer protein TraF [Burkholderia vietnamiensis]BBQ03088.1 type-F conjugative transfer system pilin assembly protein TraF [Burkholderia sp. SFA1]MDR5799264.1 conjugal transfer protein TraF [Caballeronia sp. LZ001]
MKLNKFVSLLLLGSLALPLFAQEPTDQSGRFLERKSEGWFWYKDPKDEVKKEVPPPPPPPPSPEVDAKQQPAEKPDQPFSVEWLRKNMPRFLDAAINNPTKENVETYLYAQRVAMDKSQRYAEMTQRVVAADPFLDENNRVPIAAYTKSFFLRQFNAGNAEALKHIAKVGGLWVFFDSKCEYCRPQANSVQEITKKYGFVTKFISMDGKGLPNVTEFVKDKGQAKLLNLRLTPTTVLVVPPNNYFIVSQGMMAQDQLEQRIVLAADSNNLLPPDIAKKIRTYDRGVLSNDDMQKGATKDPKEWVKYLKDRLEGRY